MKANELIEQLQALSDEEKELEVWFSDECRVFSAFVQDYEENDGSIVKIVSID